MKKIKYYIESFRLRTLPLSISGIILGSILAASEKYFNISVFCLALSTTLCLQILSNISNELGDMQKGTDNSNRLGPIRALQSGILTPKDYRRLICLFVLLSLISGIALIGVAFHALLSYDSLLLFTVGGAAVIAAIKYTIGKKPYGYQGLGDIFVFLFFGLVSTIGAFYLMTHYFHWEILLPACSIGFLTTAVLNVNNTRDIKNDALCGKNTIPVKIGESKAKIYHLFLVCGAFTTMLIYTFLYPQHLSAYIFLLTSPLFIIHLRKMLTLSGRALDPQLKMLSISTLCFAIAAGLSRLL